MQQHRLSQLQPLVPWHHAQHQWQKWQAGLGSAGGTAAAIGTITPAMPVTATTVHTRVQLDQALTAPAAYLPSRATLQVHMSRQVAVPMTPPTPYLVVEHLWRHVLGSANKGGGAGLGAPALRLEEECLRGHKARAECWNRDSSASSRRADSAACW